MGANQQTRLEQIYLYALIGPLTPVGRMTSESPMPVLGVACLAFRALWALKQAIYYRTTWDGGLCGYILRRALVLRRQAGTTE
jgi:hypothetical protein